MSDTYFVTIDCPYCGEENPKADEKIGIPLEFGKEVIYECDYCGAKFEVVMEFNAKKVKDKS